MAIEDNGDCRVFMTMLYVVPEGKTGREIDPGTVPLLFALPGTTPNLGDTIVRRVRDESIKNSESMAAKLVEPPKPPVPLSELQSLGDLIDAYQEHYFCKPFSDVLVKVLTRAGEVNHRGETWWVNFGGHVCHSETAPGSKPVTGADGQPVVYTNTSHLRLAPFLESDREQG